MRRVSTSWMRAGPAVAGAAAVLLTAGCALTTPDLRLPMNGGDFEEGLSEERLIGYVKCSLGQALHDVVSQDAADRAKYGALAPADPAPWLSDWGAQVSLKVAVDENSNLTPGLAIKTPRADAVSHFANGDVTVARSFGLGLSASATAEATRIEGLQLYFYFPDLAEVYGPQATKCQPHGRYFINGNLKIEDFVVSKVRLAQVPYLIKPRPGHPEASPLDAFTYEVTFVVTTSGGINPTWNLARLAIDAGGGNLLGASRRRTDDLIITVGPTEHGKGGPPTPTDRAREAHFAALFGQSVR